MHTSDHLIIGGGIFGLCTAIELQKKGRSVTVLEAGKIPNPLAASTDISKIIRMEYGTDEEYMDMAAESMKTWRYWNELFNETIYQEVGFLLLTSQPLGHASQVFEYSSFSNLIKKGYQPERMDFGMIKERFPAFNHHHFQDGFFHQKAGYAQSGRVLEILRDLGRAVGIQILENQNVKHLTVENGKSIGVKTLSGEKFWAGNITICAGNFTPYIVPELLPYFKVTGHPVFHIKPSRPELYESPRFAVFAADISNTGWYGFPLHPKEKVVKIALHSEGLELHPEHDDRKVTQEEHRKLRQFLRYALPELANDPVVYTRKCCYTDTLDGHFWIDNHPEIQNLTIGSGGSGHGFKMGPVIGNMIALLAEGNKHKWSKRYQWRDLGSNTAQCEEARYLSQRKG